MLCGSNTCVSSMCPEHTCIKCADMCEHTNTCTFTLWGLWNLPFHREYSSVLLCTLAFNLSKWTHYHGAYWGQSFAFSLSWVLFPIFTLSIAKVYMVWKNHIVGIVGFAGLDKTVTKSCFFLIKIKGLFFLLIVGVSIEPFQDNKYWFYRRLICLSYILEMAYISKWPNSWRNFLKLRQGSHVCSYQIK